MKMKLLRVCSLTIATIGLVLVSGCVIGPDGRMSLQLPVIDVVPVVPVVVAPAVVVEVPETYVEVPEIGFVGEVGGVYYCLDDGVWAVCDDVRLGRFHDWERAGHGDWRSHAIRNDRFRTDRNGHVQQRQDKQRKPAPPAQKKKSDKKK
jgi:hypothetical protein